MKVCCSARNNTTDVFGFLVSAYVALLPVQMPLNDELNFAPADILLILIVVLAPGQLKYRKQAWTRWHYALILVFVMGTFIYALNTGKLSRYVWLNKDAGLFSLLLSYASITSVATDWEAVRRLLRVFTLSVVAQNQVALISFALAYVRGADTIFTMYGGRRLSGLLLDPNAYGGLLVVALAICEGASWGKAPLLKGWLLLYCRLNLTLGLIFTFSRSAWISMAVPMVLLCAFQHRKAVQLALVGALTVPCLLLFGGPHFLSFFESMAGRPEVGISRFQLIADAWGQFMQHPIFGGGLGSFTEFEGTIVHNTSLWFLADFGILGFAALAGFLGWFLAAAWSAFLHAPHGEKPVVMAVLLAHTGMLTLSMGIEAFYQRHWWMVLALIACCSANCEKFTRPPLLSENLPDAPRRSPIWRGAVGTADGGVGAGRQDRPCR